MLSPVFLKKRFYDCILSLKNQPYHVMSRTRRDFKTNMSPETSDFFSCLKYKINTIPIQSFVVFLFLPYYVQIWTILVFWNIRQICFSHFTNKRKFTVFLLFLQYYVLQEQDQQLLSIFGPFTACKKTPTNSQCILTVLGGLPREMLGMDGEG